VGLQLGGGDGAGMEMAVAGVVMVGEEKN